MTGGDVLIVKDGTYNENMGEWFWSGGVKLSSSGPPGGTQENHTIIMGERVGGVIVNGRLHAVGWPEYVTVMQFTFLNGGEIDNTSQIFVSRSGFKGGLSTARSSYIYKEDIWAWGSNRYTISNYAADHVVDNRVIARLDDLGEVPSLPVGAISHYLTNYSVIANALLFDVTGSFAQPYDLVYSSRPDVGFNKLYGIIGFNAGSELGGIYPGDGGAGGHEINNSVVWGTSRRGMKFNSPGPNFVLNSTIGQNAGNAIEGQDNITANNNIFLNNGGIESLSQCDNNLFSSSGPAGSCSNSDTTTIPEIRYLPRSPISGKGATIEKRYQTTLNQNDEYDVTLTSEDLWPWPYEDIIKRDMCAESSYGWCATNKTLTEYVWEFLGYTIPPEIYGP